MAKDLEELTGLSVDLTEELCNRPVVAKCKRARLPGPLIKEIETEAKFPVKAKNMLQRGLSEIGAIYANKAEIPVEARPWMYVGIAGLQIGLGQVRLFKRLDKLIELAERTPEPPKPEEKK